MLKYLATFVTIALITTAAQSAPYFGTWTVDASKSDFGPVQITFTEKDAGQHTFTDDLAKRSYTFGIDGKDYTDQNGMIVVWTQRSPNVWHVTTTAQGKQVAVETYTLSADGRSLVDEVTILPDQKQLITLTRIGSGNGLAGTWRGTLRVSPFDLEIQPQGADGLLYRVPGAFEAKAQFDGEPVPMTGALVVNPLMAAFTRSGPRSFRTVQKERGKTIVDLTLTASDDGKTLTMIGINEVGKVSAVFTRKR